MADINRVILIGRLTRDAELKFTAGGMGISTFAVAVNRSVKNGDQWKEEASFFDVTYFGKRAEAVNQYLVKGKQVGIEGELRQERWNDKNTGQPRSKVGIVAANVQLLGSNSAPAQKPAVQNNRNKVDADGNSVMETEDTFTDDIPF